ncbi:putative membrane protein [Burkholderia pseudomallei]|nr:putative membrane protein [Burkholderia pseudomallei]
MLPAAVLTLATEARTLRYIGKGVGFLIFMLSAVGLLA